MYVKTLNYKMEQTKDYNALYECFLKQQENACLLINKIKKLEEENKRLKNSVS